MKIFNGTEVIDVEVKPSHLSPLLVDSDNHHYHPNNFITADNVDIYFKTLISCYEEQIKTIEELKDRAKFCYENLDRSVFYD